MLIQFVVENYLSFKEKTIFSMVASKEESNPTHRIKPKGTRHTLVRGAALFGANASGKSNLVKAIGFAQKQVFNRNTTNKKIPLKPFKLAKAPQTSSFFQFNFVHKGVEYSYGFRLHETHVMEEFLYGNPNGREALYFFRETAFDENGEFNTEVEFGAILNKKGRDISSFLKYKSADTLPNQLLLTALFEGNLSKTIEEITPVMEWFDSVLVIIEADAVYTMLESAMYEDESLKNFMAEFLKSIDAGITNIKIEETPLEITGKIGVQRVRNILQNKFTPEVVNDERALRDALAGRISENTQGEKVLLELFLRHASEAGEQIDFSLEDESDGTQRIMHLLPALFHIHQKQDRVYVIDELDRCLHTRLASLFLYMALQQEAENQVIVTTHDTNLISRELLRKDEIWVVDKDKFGASHLTSLAEFKTHSDMSLEKAYMQGRFGGVPHIQDMEDIGLPKKDLEPIHAP